MPTKHIQDSTWKLVEKETVKAVIETKKTVSDTKMLNLLISIGLKNIKPEDYHKATKQE